MPAVPGALGAPPPRGRGAPGPSTTRGSAGIGPSMSLDAPKAESPPVRAEADLVAWFRERERPRDTWKVGLEHEKVLLRAGTLDPVPYDGEGGVAAVLRAFCRFGYEPFEEEGRIIAAQKAGLTVSIEPG